MKALLPKAIAILSISVAALAWGTVSMADQVTIKKILTVKGFLKKKCASNGVECTEPASTPCAIIILDDGSVVCTDV